jgi:phytoene desaturase
LTDPEFIIVGSGVGGLATALRLTHRGKKVLVLEKTGSIGGRNRRLQVGKADFDSGPSLVMMRAPFERVFKDVGLNMSDYFDLKLCDPSYRVFYRDGHRIDATTNVAKMLDQLAEFSPQDSKRYPRFLGELADLYHEAVPNFVERNFDNILQFIAPKRLKIVLQRRMLGNLGSRIDKTFSHPRSRMLFSFQTMYLGLSPFDAPWVYAVLTYMEYGEGIWYPKGGVARLTEVLGELAMERGATIQTNQAVTSVQGKAVTLANGETITASRAVIMNADLPYAEREVIKPAKPKKRENSCSAFMMYMDYRGEVPELQHHNVLFGADFRSNLDDIFNKVKMPADPAFYICASSVTEPERAAPGGKNIMVLVPVPNLGHEFSEADKETLTEHVFARLEAETSFRRDKIAEMATYLPQDWQRDLNLDQGAAFGISHKFRQSAYFRPGNRSKVSKGTYFVGASTTPGNGLPMVLISAELCEQRLLQDGLL